MLAAPPTTLEELPDELQRHVIIQLKKPTIRHERIDHCWLIHALRLARCSTGLRNNVQKSHMLWDELQCEASRMTDKQLAAMLTFANAKDHTRSIILHLHETKSLRRRVASSPGAAPVSLPQWDFVSKLSGAGLWPLTGSKVLEELKLPASGGHFDGSTIAKIVSSMISVDARLCVLKFSQRDDPCGRLSLALKHLDAVVHVRAGRLPSMQCMIDGIQNLKCSHCQEALPDEKWGVRNVGGRRVVMVADGVSCHRPCTHCKKLSCQGGDLTQNDERECPTTIDCVSCGERWCLNCDFNAWGLPCSECEQTYCGFCRDVNHCDGCDELFCQECRAVCACEACDVHLCKECREIDMCEGCERFRCEECNPPDTMTDCAECAESRCVDCMSSCSGCGTAF